MKRTLPTVTLDQIFEALKEKGACWYKELGPVRLAHKLDDLADGHAPNSINLRTLNFAARKRQITQADMCWLIDHLPILVPTDMDKPVGFKNGIWMGTDRMTEHLDEWENPKPKGPQTVGDLKPGDCFGNYMVLGRTEFDYMRQPDTYPPGYPNPPGLVPVVELDRNYVTWVGSTTPLSLYGGAKFAITKKG